MEFTLIRHGNAEEAKDDFKRKLTLLGMRQAMGRKLDLEKEFDIVISSPAPRAFQTASIIAGIGISNVILCKELYSPASISDDEAMDKLFEELDCDPLQKYLERDADLFNRYGRYAHDAVWERIANNHDIEDVLIVGHAILLNTVARQISSNPLIVDCSLGECEGLCLAENGTVTHIK